MKILIDGDIIVYRTAYSVETPIYVCKNAVYKLKANAEKASIENGYPVTKRINIGSETDLRNKLHEILTRIFTDIGSADYTIYITDSDIDNNYRSKLATYLEYKGNRKDTKKPLHYKLIRKILLTEYNAELVKGQEADDEIAKEQTRLQKEHGGNIDHSIIASIDKDMLTIPGNHYNFVSRIQTVISIEDSYKNLLKQLLSGDVSDNIPGLVKLLKLKDKTDDANHLIRHKYLKKFDEFCLDHSVKECYAYVRNLYNTHGLEIAIKEIFNLLWLRRFPDQDGFEDFRKEYINDKQ